MPQMIKFPSIDDFKHISKHVQQRAQYVGKDENGEVIVNRVAVAPILTFHDTNGSICYNNNDGLWIQSRESIITPESDNAGFAWYVTSNIDIYIAMIDEFAMDNNIDLTSNTICIYGEWCGDSIQKGIALNQLPKMFVVFGIKLVTINESEASEGIWISHSSFYDESINCYNIEQILY
jgi:hypothetical protein